MSVGRARSGAVGRWSGADTRGERRSTHGASVRVASVRAVAVVVVAVAAATTPSISSTSPRWGDGAARALLGRRRRSGFFRSRRVVAILVLAGMLLWTSSSPSFASASGKWHRTPTISISRRRSCRRCRSWTGKKKNATIFFPFLSLSLSLSLPAIAFPGCVRSRDIYAHVTRPNLEMRRVWQRARVRNLLTPFPLVSRFAANMPRNFSLRKDEINLDSPAREIPIGNNLFPGTRKPWLH